MNFNNKSLQETWFNTKYNKIVNYSYQEKIKVNNDRIYKQYLRRSRKIKLRLSKQQEGQVQKWGEHYRYTYNRTVWYLNEMTEQLSFKEVRDIVIKEENNRDKEWLLETPSTIRESAVNEVYKERERDIIQKEKSVQDFNKEDYKQQYMKKKDKIRKFTIQISNKQIRRLKEERKRGEEKSYQVRRFETRKFVLFEEERSIVIQTKEDLPIEFGTQDIKLQFDGIDYNIIIPITRKSKEIWRREEICVLDPGMRVFQTLYNPKRNYQINLGEKSASSILYRLKILDRMIMEYGFNSKKRQRLILKMMKRIRNLQKEQHNKIANYLCQNYSTIVIGDLKIRELKYGGVIKTQEARRMDRVGHKQFVQKLKSKAEEYKCNLVVQDEGWTSKKCCKCGKKKMDLGMAKVYNCDGCGLVINRDVNGAINILRKQQGYYV